MATPVRTIIIAPLDWGLGHTTRCIPVVRHLITLGHIVLFAGNPRQQAFAAAQCPQITLLDLEGYNVKYHPHRLMAGLFFQIPRLLKAIRREHEWLRQLAQEIKIDGIISDNRYGLWHPQIPCVIMTHQPAVRSGLGAIADRMVRKLHYRYLEKFGKCWIVDVAGSKNLAGRLSHPKKLPCNARFIGWLSQLCSPEKDAPMRYKCLVLLSGPEPHRSILSDELFEQVAEWPQSVAFVEGSDAIPPRAVVPPHIQCFGQVDAPLLQRLMEQSSFVICRSGYSTLMDLVRLQKKAALIPTPGQTEQEYLAASLSDRRLFYAAWPTAWSMEEAIEHMEKYAAEPLSDPDAFSQFIPVLEDWLAHL